MQCWVSLILLVACFSSFALACCCQDVVVHRLVISPVFPGVQLIVGTSEHQKVQHSESEVVLLLTGDHQRCFHGHHFVSSFASGCCNKLSNEIKVGKTRACVQFDKSGTEAVLLEVYLS
jgi:hypothetical protein